MDPKYDIDVRLTGQDGNAYNLLGIVQYALRKHGVAKSETDEFIAEATSGNYGHLLRTCATWVNVS